MKWMAFALFVVACGPKPSGRVPTSNPDREHLEELEKRLDTLEKQVMAMVENPRLAALEERAESLLAEIEDVAAGSLAKAPPPPPRPRTYPAPRPRPSGPQSNVLYSVPTAGSPSVGSDRAWVTWVLAYDIGPYVKRLSPTIDTLKREFGADLRVVYQGHPVFGSKTEPAKLALCAAHRQRRFAAYWKALFADSRAYPQRDFRDEVLEDIATQAGLSLSAFSRDMRSTRCKRQIKTEEQRMKTLGVRGVPGSYINGRFLGGAMPINRFRDLIRAELKRAKASGLKKHRYYRHLVRTGKKTP